VRLYGKRPMNALKLAITNNKKLLKLSGCGGLWSQLTLKQARASMSRTVGQVSFAHASPACAAAPQFSLQEAAQSVVMVPNSWCRSLVVL